MSVSLDLLFCSKLIASGKFGNVTDIPVQKWLKDEQGRKVFHFVQDFQRKFGQLPTPVTVLRGAEIELPDAEATPEPLSYYIEELKRRHVAGVVGSALERAMELLKKGNPLEAADHLQESAASLYVDLGASESGLVDLVQMGEVLKREYLKVKAAGGIDGIRSPWPMLDEFTGGFHPEELIIIVGRPSLGKCVAMGTRVPDPRTGIWNQVEDVVSEQRDVVTFSMESGRWSPVRPSGWWDTGTKRCLRIKTRLGWEIVVTPEHPILTSRGWVRADQLTLSDSVVAVAKIPEPTEPIDLPAGEVDFLAILLSEGSFSGNHVGFSTSDQAMLETAEQAAQSLGLEVVHRDRYDYDFVEPDREGRGLGSARRLLKKHGLGRLKALEKFVPESVYRLPNVKLARFLRTFWMGDGGKDGQTIGLASEQLIDDLRFLLLRFGVVTKKRYKPTTCNGKRFDSWELRVESWTLAAFRELMSEMPGEKGEYIRNLPPASKSLTDFFRPSSETLAQIDQAAREYKRWDVRPEDRRGFYTDVYRELGWRGKGDLKRITDRGGRGRFHRKMLGAVLQVAGEGLASLEWMASKEIVFDQVTAIEEAGEQRVFDLTVEGTHCFLAEGFAAHNTWSLVKVGEVAWAAGEKPLFVSKEMSAFKIARRFVSVHGKFCYRDTRKGHLGEFVEPKYFAMLDEIRESSPFMLISGSRIRTVADLDIVIAEVRPTIVLVDGLYLLKPREWSGGALWERVTAVVDELHQSAQHWKLPFIATTQFARDAVKGKKKLKGGLENIGFSDAIGQFADIVLSLNQDEDLADAKKMLWKCLKGRESEKLEFVTNWDLDKMDLDQSEEDNEFD